MPNVQITPRDTITFTDVVSVIVDGTPVDNLAKENNAITLEWLDNDVALIEGMYGDNLGVVSVTRRGRLTLRVKPDSLFLRDKLPNLRRKQFSVTVFDKNESTFVKWISTFAFLEKYPTTERGAPELNAVEISIIGTWTNTE